MDLDAPIVAVTVHPRRARISRRGRADLPAGSTDLVIAGLPTSLLDDSVRVAGRSTAPVRVLGVDLARSDLVDAPDERVARAEAALRDAERAVAVVDGLDAGDAAREAMLGRLARSSGARLAVALADGAAGAERVAEVGAAVAAQLADVAASRQASAERRTDAQHARNAALAELDRLKRTGRDRRVAVIGVEADAAGEVEIELTYVVEGAGWSSAYDARLGDDDQVAVTWFGMVEQSTGEDWPECELTLSTARPAVSAAVPELDPWWIDVFRPPPMPVMAAGGMPALAPRQRVPLGTAEMATDSFAATGPVEVVEARVVEGTVAASWRLPRPTAIPGDGTPHRAGVTAFSLPARLDHVTAPSQSLDAHLRATVTNSSGQVLLTGPVSTFLDDAFVGTTALEQTAPGGEVELALGVDDRVVVERELAERTTHKARFSSTRGATERWTVTVTNRRAATARVTVRDRLPVSRNPDIKVVDVKLAPEPTERDDLGRVEWAAEVAPGASWEASIRFGVEHPKDLPVAGWR